MHSLQTLLQRPPRQSNFKRSVFRLLQFTNETFTNRVVPPPQLKTWIPSTFHYEVTDILRSRMRTTHQHTCVASFNLLRNAVFCWYFSSVKNEPCGVAAGKKCKSYKCACGSPFRSRKSVLDNVTTGRSCPGRRRTTKKWRAMLRISKRRNSMLDSDPPKGEKKPVISY